MAYIRKNGIWRPSQVPSIPVVVDWKHPLAEGLVQLFLPGGPQGPSDLTGNTFGASYNGGISRTVSQQGLGVLGNGSTGYVSMPNSAVNTPTNNCTIFVTTANASPSATGAVFGKWFDGTNYGFYFEFLAHDAPNFNWGNSGQTFNGRQSQNQFASWTSVVTYSTGVVNNYFNGTFDSTFTGSANQVIASSPLSICSTYDSGSQNRFMNAHVPVCGIYNRALSAQEVLWLYNEPYAMLKQKADRRYYVGASGGNRSAARGTASAFGRASAGYTAPLFGKAGISTKGAGQGAYRASIAAGALIAFRGTGQGYFATALAARATIHGKGVASAALNVALFAAAAIKSQGRGILTAGASLVALAGQSLFAFRGLASISGKSPGASPWIPPDAADDVWANAGAPPQSWSPQSPAAQQWDKQ